MGRAWRKLGIVAGGGDLPLSLAKACEADGTPFAVLRLAGFADESTAAYRGLDAGIGEVGKIVRLLKGEGCDALVMAGNVARPNFAAVKPDWRGAALLPKVVAAARRGDDALLTVLVEAFEAEGFTVVGADEVAGGLIVEAGPLGAQAPTACDWTDIVKAAAVLEALGPFDVGQGAVVRNGLVLAVEAAEGTDAMLARCAALPAALNGREPGDAEGGRGVLVKRPKPGQELRVDLPTIGVATVRGAAEAGLAGVAVAAGAALVMNRPAVIAAANEAGLFVYGYEPGELAS